MSRVGSFLLRTAHVPLKKYCNNPRIVLDPFCGKGTSLFAASSIGSQAYGLDTGPEAVVCTSAKLNSVSNKDVAKYLQAIELKTPIQRSVPEQVQLFFHPETLRQIICVNDNLQKAYRLLRLAGDIH